MKKAPAKVGIKTEILIREGKTPSQAYAMAWNMYREGRLGQHGAYSRVRRPRP